MVAVRCVCVCVWVVGGGCDVISNITEGGLVLSKFLLDNSSFSAPHLLIIIAQSLSIISAIEYWQNILAICY